MGHERGWQASNQDQERGRQEPENVATDQLSDIQVCSRRSVADGKRTVIQQEKAGKIGLPDKQCGDDEQRQDGCSPDCLRAPFGFLREGRNRVETQKADGGE